MNRQSIPSRLLPTTFGISIAAVCIAGVLAADPVNPPVSLPGNPRMPAGKPQTNIGCGWNCAGAKLRRSISVGPIRSRKFPPGAIARAQTQIESAQPQGSPPGISFYQFYNLGPAPMTQFISSGGQSLNVSGAGRWPQWQSIRSSDSDHWLLGSAQGGVWETTNSGGAWWPRTDDAASLAVGAIAFAPSNPSQQFICAGTGEGNFSGDCYAGAGLLQSTDGGTTWTMLNSYFAGNFVQPIRVDNLKQNNVTVATVSGIAGFVDVTTNPPGAPPTGVYVSTNGGKNFTQPLTGQTTDLLANPNLFKEQYAGLGNIFGDPTNGIYRTTNSWGKWERINGPWTALADPTNMGRVALAISPNITGTVYVGVANTADVGGLVGIWETTNAWAPASKIVWTQLPAPEIVGSPWYSFTLSVDPDDYTTLFFGEAALWRYSSGFWSDLSGVATPYAVSTTHADQHCMAWVPQGFSFFRMLLGNDGGVWESTAPPSTIWTDMNTSGLAINQMYRGSVHPQPGHTLLLAGTQDNGSAFGNGSLSWQAFLTGDGFDNAISGSSPDTDWSASWETFGGEVNIYRTQDAGSNMDNVSSGIDPSTAPFFVHFAKSPRNDDVFIAGTIQLWLCTNFFSGSVIVRPGTRTALSCLPTTAPTPLTSAPWLSRPRMPTA